MISWNKVITQSDVDSLLEIYGGFHDACIINLNYTSGANVDESLSMIYGAPEDSKVSVVFKRQWKPASVELLFEGMRKMNIAGWQNNYSCDIIHCYLAFHNDLIKGLDQNLIVWADSCSFNPKELPDRKILQEPMTTYIISNSLKWRIIAD